jgi:eukaryotic-like serine/threonine-protein kinase
MIGKDLSHYRITATLNAGGMGVIYRANDQKLGRDVAIKVLPAEALHDETARKRLFWEARTAAELNHPNICTIFEVDEFEGQVFIAMELVQGRSLKEILLEDRLPVDVTLRYGIQIADALAHAHDRGVIHRDLKSANIMITADGRAKVLDFGLARHTASSDVDTQWTRTLSDTGFFAGTLPYSAPEILRGAEGDSRGDLWALGVVLYESLQGSLPFQGTTPLELASAILNDPPRPTTIEVPSALRAIVGRCLTKDLNQRFRSASEIRVGLEAIQAAGSQSTSVKEPTGSRKASGRIRSLFVRPFDNLSRDPAQEFFADGMTEELIAALSKVGSLKVISRTSSMRFKGSQRRSSEIATELKVDAVVEGSVRQYGGRVRITVELVRAKSDMQIWAESYEGSLENVLQLQSDAARAVAGEIQVKLSNREKARLATFHPVDPDAYRLVLHGRNHLNHRTESEFISALDCFRQAVQRDPTYAAAHLGVAEALFFLTNYGLRAPAETYAEVKDETATALALGKKLAEAHIVTGLVQWQYEWNWDASIRAIRRGIALKPGAATGHYFYGIVLGTQRMFERSLAELQRAQQLDPFWAIPQALQGWVHVWAGRLEEAITAIRAALALDPESLPAILYLGLAYALQGKYSEGCGILEQAVRLSGRSARTLGYLGYACARAGDEPAAQRVLAELARLAERIYVPFYFSAIVYSGLGDSDRAFAALSQASAAREAMLRDILVDRAFDSIRSDYRYGALLTRMGLDNTDRRSAGLPA